MFENIIELCDKEVDAKKDMVFEVKNKETNHIGYLNIDSKDDADLEGHGTWITSKFAYTTYGMDLEDCPVNEIYLDKDGYIIKRIK